MRRWQIGILCFSAVISWLHGVHSTFAGDILRGGAGRAHTPTAGVDPAALPVVSPTDAVAARGTDLLARHAQVVQDFHRMQQAAREAAAASGSNHAGFDPLRPSIRLPDVANGLAPGGLVPAAAANADPSLWQGAELPTQESVADRLLVNVRQTAAQALLNWDSFHVGSQTELHFEQVDQGAAQNSWVVINQVNDPGANPTQILGNIRAAGEVYIINPNGILFGAGSEVNLRSLTVSSLPLNYELLNRGLLNNPDGQFLFSAFSMPAGANGTLAFTAPAAPVETGRFGDIRVEAGAMLASTVSELNAGGRILLAAPRVVNEGVISTPGGQTILAAGAQLGLVAHPGDDPSLRGLDPFIGAIGPDGPVPGSSGSVINAGLIEAPRGNITLAGADIRHDGILFATTSVSLNGRIDLLAHYDALQNPESAISAGATHRLFLPRSSGSVVTGPTSSIAVLPEITSEETVVAERLALRSQINFAAAQTRLGANSLVLAPGGDVRMTTGEWRYQALPRPDSRFVVGTGSIALESGSTISVAGLTGVESSVEQNILRVELRGAELADAPLQRLGVLRGQEIRVDTRKSGNHNGVDWVGTPLANVSGFLGLIERTVGELSTAGGTVDLRAGDSITLAENSHIDVSGGWLDYQAGSVATTRLLQGGRVVDISSAIPEIRYDGIYRGFSRVDYSRWGFSAAWAHPLAPLGVLDSPGYLHGDAAGSLNLRAPAMVLDGQLGGFSFNGERQLENPVSAASLRLDFTANDLSIAPLYPVYAPTSPLLVIANRQTIAAGNVPQGTVLSSAGALAATGSDGWIQLDLRLFTPGGFGNLEVLNPGGDILIPAGSDLAMAARGSLSMEGANMRMDGTIRIPAGVVDLRAATVDLSTVNRLEVSSVRVNPLPDPTRGRIILGSEASIDVAGGRYDYRAVQRDDPAALIDADSGSIALAAFDIELAKGSVLRADAGYYLGAGGVRNFGSAGEIRLDAGRDIRLDSVIGGTLSNGALLHAYGFASGGALRISSAAFAIASTPDIGALDPRISLVDTTFFSAGGFSAITLQGIGLRLAGNDRFQPGVEVLPGADLYGVVESIRFNSADFGSAEPALERYVAEDALRSPLNLHFGASGARDPYAQALLVRGEVKVAEGASVRTDAGGEVTITASAMTIGGAIEAPGGRIALRGGSSYESDSPDQTRALPTVYLAENAALLAAGRTETFVTATGWQTGTVYSGGTISVSGNVLAATGSRLDVSGSSGSVDVPVARIPGYTGPIGGLSGRAYQTVDLVSSGGTISLAGAELLATNATLAAHAGGDAASGGTLQLQSGRFYADNETRTTADITVDLYAGLSGHAGTGSTQGTGQPVTALSGETLRGGGHYGADSIDAAGFDHVRISGNARFNDAIDLGVAGSILIATGGLLETTQEVSLNAPYVALGQAWRGPEDPDQRLPLFTQNIPGLGQRDYLPQLVSGSGSLTVGADFLDVGNLILNGMHQLSMDTGSGDIRGYGVVNLAGSMELNARRIYPDSAAEFQLNAYPSTTGEGMLDSGTIRISGGGGDAVLPIPFSAGGQMSVHAAQIEQGGHLQAPYGTIEIGWDGISPAALNRISGEALPVARNVILLDGSVTSVAAMSPGSDQATALPYGVLLNDIAWIDPRGLDVTLEDLPEMSVKVSGIEIQTQPDSVIDARGGGDFIAYRWIPGPGGSRDVLSDEQSFAVIPGMVELQGARSLLNPAAAADLFSVEAGYRNANLRVGDQIVLPAAGDLGSGTYTLLPARYALLEGAFLVTHRSGTPVGDVQLADGAHLVSGIRYSGLNGQAQGDGLLRNFEVAPAATVAQRSEYALYSANEFLSAAAVARERTTQPLPQDSAQVVYSALASIELLGSLQASALGLGRGSPVDINSPLAIVISTDAGLADSETLVLDPTVINRYGAESLLVGGVRNALDGSLRITVNSPALTVDNANDPLIGADLILVARDQLTLAEGAELLAPEAVAGRAVPLQLGDGSAGSADGLLLRVTSATDAGIVRSGTSANVAAQMQLDSGARLSGNSIVLDSSASAVLDPSVELLAGAVSLSGSRVRLVVGDDASCFSDGMTIAGSVADGLLNRTTTLALRGYTGIEFVGTGEFGSEQLRSILLDTPRLGGALTGDDGFVLSAGTIRIGNSGAESVPATASDSGRLIIVADDLILGSGIVSIDDYREVRLTANRATEIEGEGALQVPAHLVLNTPSIGARKRSDYSVNVGGDLELSGGSVAEIEPLVAAGAVLRLDASAVQIDNAIHLSGGEIHVRARSGDIVVGGNDHAILSVAGIVRQFGETPRPVNAGSIVLQADTGMVHIGARGIIDVSAASAGGDAGQVSLHAPKATVRIDGVLDAASTTGHGGEFNLDLAVMDQPNLGALDAMLNASNFSHSRAYRIRSGDVALVGNPRSSQYVVSVDQGSLRLSGAIDASGQQGGFVHLVSAGALQVLSGASIDVSALDFDHAGKGGRVLLESGTIGPDHSRTEARISLEAGSAIDLSVASLNDSSATNGQFAGILTLRTPVTDDGRDLRMDPIGSRIVEPAHIRIEGHRVIDLTGSDGRMDTSIREQVRDLGLVLVGSAGVDSESLPVLRERLFGLQPELADYTYILPSVEVINRNGNLTLGSAQSSAAEDWNLAGYRFGAAGVPGTLTLGASGDVWFYNALSDGFNGGSSLWLAELMPSNPALPANLQSWSFTIVAGAGNTTGSVFLGKNTGAAVASGGVNAVTSSVINDRFQVIRTGTGDIRIAAAGDLVFLNPFASIYTAGTRMSNPTTIFQTGDFSLPVLRNSGVALSQGSLGVLQQNYPVQYSLAGGNVSIVTGGSMLRQTRDALGNLILDTSRQLPSNWLYRRGYVDATGNFGALTLGSGLSRLSDPSASTTWWVDFSNFFQGVGALGGGNVLLAAGKDIINVDAVVPTNARMPSGKPDNALLREHGGGDLRVIAGGDISGGIYWVESGVGQLRAGNSITTNAARTQSLGILGGLNNPVVLPSATWLPTTLFVGKGSWDVLARGDLLMGPVTNPFLLPQSVNNRYWYKTHFSTFSADSSLSLQSLGGSVTVRSAVTLPDSPTARNALQVWLIQQSLLSTGANGAAFFQPWLRSVEDSMEPFATLLSSAPSSLRITAFDGDVRLAGTFNLHPSPQGNLELLAAGNIIGLNPTGVSDRIIPGRRVAAWGFTRINLSDADPAFIPGVANPFAYVTQVGTGIAANNQTLTGFLQPVNRFFTETGATNSVLQTKQALHAANLLHANTATPAIVQAAAGSVSGLVLFAAKPTHVIASKDISDIDLYIQNTATDHVSFIASGRDIIAFIPVSDFRLQARSDGNALSLGQSSPGGDLQISGPGTLHVLAGRNFDLGIGASNADGTAVGLTSVGNLRNPFLPARGADVILAAGIGEALNLTQSRLDFDGFIDEVLNPANAADSRRVLADLAIEMGLPDTADTWEQFSALDPQQRNQLALWAFFRVLRNAGRDFNNPDSPGFGVYDSGFAAIERLFPEAVGWDGGILLTSRQIKTAAGGDVQIVAPGGGLLVGLPIADARADQGILTEAGGDIAIFTHDSVTVGASRIFTLRGGDAVIWSSTGDIAAGSAARTVRAAPPTRVIFDPQTAAVQTDLSGLATGGGIGVLQTVAGVEPGDVDLIAPAGIIDAGDAGIRVSGSLNIAAVEVVNAANIQAGGAVGGVPVTVVAIPDIGGITAASGSTAAAGSAMDDSARRQALAASSQDAMPSVVTVEVIGFGGRDPDAKDETEDDNGEA